ncbi:hypothetical protein HAX54_032587 [Datura stramonium]|uniref:Aminotransferase-like plant mobile domain-containing protein n=1 Tax=Datura stramonium TaxID=4076 RepID=A0ABS8VCG0_DATST|nr:hypothetical protein [Datura stramonium]
MKRLIGVILSYLMMSFTTLLVIRSGLKNNRSAKVFKAAKVYDVVYDSPFTYNRNTKISYKAFCEACRPLTNALLTSTREISISLWDLNTIGSLFIVGSLYEKVMPNVAELIGTYDGGKRFLPQACDHLFDAFRWLWEGNNNNSNVLLRMWIVFWCKKSTKYEQPPLRKEKKSSHLKSLYNPTGLIDKDVSWLTVEEALFHKLGVKSYRKDETYLAAFLSCWLCIFVIPTKEADPFIALYSGEDATRNFEKEDARKRIHEGGGMEISLLLSLIILIDSVAKLAFSKMLQVHGNFLKNHMQFLVNFIGPVTDALQEHNEETHQTSNKRPSPDENSSGHEDHCWKKVKPSLDDPRDTNLHAVEISNKNGSSSRILTVIKEPKNVNILEISHQKVEKSKSLLKAKEHNLVLGGKSEKSIELYAAHQSLKQAKKKVKELKGLQDATKKGIEEVESKFSVNEE